MSKRLTALLVALFGGALLVCATVTVLAQGGLAGIGWWVAAGGGGASGGGGVHIDDTLAQPIVGASTGGNVALGAGYWTGVGSEPDLSIAKVVSPDVGVCYGCPVTYTIVLENGGAADADGAAVTDTLPVSTTFGYWVGSSGGAVVTAGPPDEIAWSGTVTAGQSITLSFVVSQEADYSTVVTNVVRYSHTTSSGIATAAFSLQGAVYQYLPLVLR